MTNVSASAPLFLQPQFQPRRIWPGVDVSGSGDRFVAGQSDPELEKMANLRRLAQTRQVSAPRPLSEQGLIGGNGDAGTQAQLEVVAGAAERGAAQAGARGRAGRDAGYTVKTEQGEVLPYGELRFLNESGQPEALALELDDFPKQPVSVTLEDDRILSNGSPVRHRPGLMMSFRSDDKPGSKRISLYGYEKTPWNQLPPQIQQKIQQVRKNSGSRLLSEVKLLTLGGMGDAGKDGRYRGETVDLKSPTEVRAYRDRVAKFAASHQGELDRQPDGLGKEMKRLQSTLVEQEHSAVESRLGAWQGRFSQHLGEAIKAAPEGSDLHKLGQLYQAQMWAQDKNSEMFGKIDPHKVDAQIEKLLSQPGMDKKIQALQERAEKEVFPDRPLAAQSQAEYLDSAEFQKKLQALPADQRDTVTRAEWLKLQALSPDLAQRKNTETQLRERLSQMPADQRQAAMDEWVKAVGQHDPQLARDLQGKPFSPEWVSLAGRGGPLLAKVPEAVRAAGGGVRGIGFVGQMLGGGPLAGALSTKVLPVAGSLLSAYQAYDEFANGDTVGGFGKSLGAVGGALMIACPVAGLVLMGGGFLIDVLGGETPQETTVRQLGVGV